MSSLFVYGTLCPGKPNAHLLENIGGTWEKGYIKGTLYPAGWGAAMGYPGVILDGSDHQVEGYLFYAEHLGAHWEALDAFEGAEYQRVPVQAYLENGATADTFVYVLKEPPGQAVS